MSAACAHPCVYTSTQQSHTWFEMCVACAFARVSLLFSRSCPDGNLSLIARSVAAAVMNGG